MSDIAKLIDDIVALKAHISQLDESNKEMRIENQKLKANMEHIKSVVNRQAAYIAEIDGDLDDLGQYNRRENVVFTNLLVSTDQSPADQVIELCKEIDVAVSEDDIVACHALPSNPGKPKRFIARFHNRATAQRIFRNRKKAKNISPDAKRKLASNSGKGFGIMPNLTVKRGKFFGQVSEFCEQHRHEGCWIDPNTGKILLKLRGTDRARAIKTTADLVEIDSSYIPKDWYFCSIPGLNTVNDISTPANGFGNANLSVEFSPVDPLTSSPLPQGNIMNFGFNPQTGRFDQGSGIHHPGNSGNRGQGKRGRLNRSY